MINNLNTKKGFAPILIAFIVALIAGGGLVIAVKSSSNLQAKLGLRPIEKVKKEEIKIENKEIKTEEKTEEKILKKEDPPKPREKKPDVTS